MILDLGKGPRRDRFGVREPFQADLEMDGHIRDDQARH